MKCQFCKEEIVDGAIKCKHCGSMQDTISESNSEEIKNDSTDTVECKYCGELIPEFSFWCKHCKKIYWKRTLYGLLFAIFALSIINTYFIKGNENSTKNNASTAINTKSPLTPLAIKFAKISAEKMSAFGIVQYGKPSCSELYDFKLFNSTYGTIDRYMGDGKPKTPIPAILTSAEYTCKNPFEATKNKYFIMMFFGLDLEFEMIRCKKVLDVTNLDTHTYDPNTKSKFDFGKYGEITTKDYFAKFAIACGFDKLMTKELSNRRKAWNERLKKIELENLNRKYNEKINNTNNINNFNTGYSQRS